jgi:eukaryotic-like serine/threonine-protein kinase
MTPDVVGGRYRLTELLGAGGTARVYAAIGPSGAQVAVKILRPHLAASDTMRSAFFEEVRAAGSLQHPAIAQVLDAGVDGADSPVVWIAMELVRGRTLAEIVRAEGPLELPDALVAADALLDALAAAHRGGVVHRDVSPANVMLDPDARGDAAALAASVRLLDFGLADIPGRSTAGADPLLSEHVPSSARGGPHGGVVASVPYASPEHLRGEPVEESGDVYQAACTIFFALTGRPPFVGDHDDIVHAHANAEPPRVSALRPDVPRAVDRWLAGALAKAPHDRFANAAVMRARAPAADAAGTAVADIGRAWAGEDEGPGRTRVLPLTAGATPVGARVSGAGGRADSAHTAGLRLGSVLGGLVVLGALGVAAISAAGAAPSAAVPTTSASASAVSASPSASATPTADAVAPGEASIVPEVAGLSLADARTRLAAAEIAVADVVPVDVALSADTVIASEPGAGAAVAAGGVVLRVASGSNRVPEVAGQSVAAATAALAEAGFSTVVRVLGAGAAGAVTGTDPVAGTVLPLGAGVVVSAAAVPPAATPSAPPSPTAIPSPTPTGGG